jgi:hypothetical protein
MMILSVDEMVRVASHPGLRALDQSIQPFEAWNKLVDVASGICAKFDEVAEYLELAQIVTVKGGCRTKLGQRKLALP